MNSRTKLLTAASVVLAALACSSCGGGRRELQAALPQATPQSLLADAAAQSTPATKSERRGFTPLIEPALRENLRVESINERDDELGREIDFTFPLLIGEAGRRADGFNRAVEALAEGVVGDFKRSHAGAVTSLGGLRDSLLGSYQTTHLTEALIGVRFFVNSNSREGRNALSFRVLNFDLHTGKTLSLGDLFKPGANYLDRIAAYCIADLKRQAAEEHRREIARLAQLGKPASHAGVPADDLIESGAAAEADNYRAWNLAAEGILVSFAACQVDSCATGNKEVLVPFSALAEVLDENGPAARLVAR